MEPQAQESPTQLLSAWRGLAEGMGTVLAEYEEWWRAEGCAISAAVDRQGTPGLQIHDRFGEPEDRILYTPEYRRMLERGYRAGVVARTAEEGSLLPGYELGYVTSFFDPGLYCPYTVSLGTLLPLLKYGSPQLQERFVPAMTRRDGEVWQGATWMTEAGGGSDLGRQVRTRARCEAGSWHLHGDKYFCSNVDAELAVVAARPEGARPDVRGLALFLVPRWRADGTLNYRIRRLKDKIATRSVPTGEVILADSEAWLLGEHEQGIYLIMEVLNSSRVANSVGAVALLQRAIAEACTFARGREVFGTALLEQPLFRQQLNEWREELRTSFALAWEAAEWLDAVWRQEPPYSESYHVFRLLAHLAKLYTADRAVAAARWAMEIHGGAGALHEYPPERLLREAMILGIWEGTPHRQILDGIAVMERTRAHERLFAHLGEPAGATVLRERIEALLAASRDEREAGAEAVFHELARWTGTELARRRLPPVEGACGVQ